MSIPKPPGRVVDRSAIIAARRTHCQLCSVDLAWDGERSRGAREGNVAHVKSRGAGGDDVLGNLVALCFRCHDKAHAGRVERYRLKQLAVLQAGGECFCPKCAEERWRRG